MRELGGLAILTVFLILFSHQLYAASPVTVLAPNQPAIDAAALNQDSKKNRKKTPPPLPLDEVDVLMAMLEPHENTGFNMDRPSLFAMLYYPENFDPSSMRPEFINLLGDVEEIRYLDKKAWGANVSVARPGLYQFLLETKPWWDETKERYLQQQVKTIMPVIDGGAGWNAPFGQSFEILPLTRPFGLSSPALFSAKVLLDGKPLDNIHVRMGRVNVEHAKAPTKWHKDLEASTNAFGEFSFVLNAPGWWYCEASIPGAPLKGPDGQMKDLERTTVLWLYVDPPANAKTAK